MVGQGGVCRFACDELSPPLFHFFVTLPLTDLVRNISPQPQVS